MDLGNVLEKALRGTDFLDVYDSEDEEDEEEWSGGDILVERAALTSRNGGSGDGKMEDEAFPPSESEEDKVADEDALTSSGGKLFFSCSGCLVVYTLSACFVCLSAVYLSIYLCVSVITN